MPQIDKALTAPAMIGDTSTRPTDICPVAGIESTIESIAAQINRLQSKLSPARAQSQPEEPFNNESSFLKFSRSLTELEANLDEALHRLSQSESMNHELGLQLRAKASESCTDGLTGLFNRRWFDKEFEQRTASAKQSGCPVTIALIDIDHFKVINDTRGHHVGDAVLRAIAKLLGEQLPTGAVLARVGGEEFAILLSGVNIDDAIEAVDQLRRHIGETCLNFEGRLLQVTVSCGLSQLGPLEHPGHLMQRADTALYGAKQAGRNRTFWHDGNQLHLVASVHATSTNELSSPVELDSKRVLDINEHGHSTASHDADPFAATRPRTSRSNWCDGGMLFWFIRQRIAEWKRGGSPFCVIAIDVDNREQIAKSYGSTALHFMMRAQQFHLEAALRDMDVIARTSSSRIICVLPGCSIDNLGTSLDRLRQTMDRFAYPVGTRLLDYSVSLGASEVCEGDDATSIVLRTEVALAKAQSLGNARFVGANLAGTWELAGAVALGASQPVTGL